MTRPHDDEKTETVEEAFKAYDKALKNSGVFLSSSARNAKAKAKRNLIAAIRVEHLPDSVQVSRQEQNKALSRSDQPQLRACEADPRGDDRG